MIESLKNREIPKRSDAVSLSGRILYLTEDAELIRRQLDGHDIAEAKGLDLRDDISTDEITPAYICYYYDEKLGDPGRHQISSRFTIHRSGQTGPLIRFPVDQKRI